MKETLHRMMMVDYHIRTIRELVDGMSALSDSEIANISARLDVFEEEYHRQSDYLRPKVCIECGHINDDNPGDIRCRTCAERLLTE